MKQLYTILTLIVFVIVSFSGFIRFASFKCFKTQFTSAYCINKDNAAVKCGGKCLLSKMMKEEEKQQKSILPEFQKIDLICESSVEMSLLSIEHVTDSPQYADYLYTEPLGFFTQDSPPPRFI